MRYKTSRRPCIALSFLCLTRTSPTDTDTSMWGKKCFHALAAAHAEKLVAHPHLDIHIHYPILMHSWLCIGKWRLQRTCSFILDAPWLITVFCLQYQFLFCPGSNRYIPPNKSNQISFQSELFLYSPLCFIPVSWFHYLSWQFPITCILC